MTLAETALLSHLLAGFNSLSDKAYAQPATQSKRRAWVAPHVSPSAVTHLFPTVIPQNNTHTHIVHNPLWSLWNLIKAKIFFSVKIWHKIILILTGKAQPDINKWSITRIVVLHVNTSIQPCYCPHTLVTVTGENASSCCNHTRCICSSGSVYLHLLSREEGSFHSNLAVIQSPLGQYFSLHEAKATLSERDI